MYANGQGVAKDESTAVKWYRKAAEQGLVQAQNNLAGMLADGQGVPQNFSEALRWLRKAAAQGDKNAAIGIKHVQGMQEQQQQAAAAAESSPSPAPIPTNTTTVHLRGLQAKPELNGQRGVVTGFDASSGRCSVQLEDGRGPYKIKPENLEVVKEMNKKSTTKGKEKKHEKKKKKKKKK